MKADVIIKYKIVFADDNKDQYKKFQRNGAVFFSFSEKGTS